MLEKILDCLFEYFWKHSSESETVELLQLSFGVTQRKNFTLPTPILSVAVCHENSAYQPTPLPLCTF